MLSTLKRLVPIATLFAFVLSTQYLFQPFVWRHWPVDIVLIGWLEILRDRLLVAGCLAIAIAWAMGKSYRVDETGHLTMAAAIVLGAAAGQALLYGLGVPGAPSSWKDAVEPVVRWSVFAGGLYIIWITWVRSRDAQLAARDAFQAQTASDLQRSSLRQQALQAQLEPHFLFNTLATVKRLGSVEPKVGRDLLLNLKQFVKLSEAAHPNAARWSLGLEVELIRAYLAVIVFRMNGRLTTVIDIAPGLNALEVPPLALATLVENAVKHGIAPSSRPGRIEVRARHSDHRLTLEVIDTGLGFRSGSGTGIGLANTRDRLRTRYGDGAGLALRANSVTGVTATLHLPARLP